MCEEPHGEVLTICMDVPDCDRLRATISHTNWSFDCVAALSDTLQRLREHLASVVVCGTPLRDGTWKDIVRSIETLSHPHPEIVVFTEGVDERVWREVLDSEAYDVLSKPSTRPTFTRS